MPETQTQPADPAALVELCHHRWSIPVLAALDGTGGGRFVQLLKTLNAPRESLSTALQALVEQDYVLKNPGYGHPLRPEYLLTPFGQDAAPASAALEAALKRLGPAADGLRRKWAMPVLLLLDQSVDRFSELRDGLAGVTPRALAATLRALEDDGFVERTVDETARPPRAAYRPARAARRVLPAIAALARALAGAA